MKPSGALSPRQMALVKLLADGNPRSAIDIANALRMGDARSAIRFIRNKGVAVSDIWINGEYGRYKRYFIRQQL